jgi:hypothetical protein
MGMFDYLNVDKSLLQNLVEEDILVALQQQEDKECYNFQTKSLDCLMDAYFIKNDNKLYHQKLQLGWEEGDFDKNEEITFCNDITEYISFHDLLPDVNGYQVFLTFKAHVVCGIVQNITLVKTEKTELKQLQDETKEHRLKWLQVENEWDWIIGTFIFEWKLKIDRFFRRISAPIDDYIFYKRTKAQAKYFPAYNKILENRNKRFYKL